MSRYEFPGSSGRAGHDDPTGRQGFLAQRRRDFDPEGAHAAREAGSRRRRGRSGGPAAPPAGRRNLWLPIGPDIVVNGQATGRPRVTGRVRALAVHPAGERIYAGAANGGVWYSGDGGRSWKSIGGFAPTPALVTPRLAHRHVCGSILVRFRASVGQDEVFVGTGEGGGPSGQPGQTLGGLGVLSATGPADDDVLGNPWTLEGQAQFDGAAVFRLAEEPDGPGIVAATSVGLFRRGATAADPWTRESGTPFDTFASWVTSVAWTPASGTTPERLWAWVSGGAELWVKDMSVPDADFDRVATPGAAAGRGVIAPATPPTTVFVFNDRGAKKRNALFKVTSGSAKPTAKLVVGVPDVVRKQGHYDIAAVVHPTNPARVLLGGSWVNVASPSGAVGEDYNGAIYSGTVTGGSSPSFNSERHIGIGVHPDVHDLVFSNDGGRLYVACDGGVFRSDDPTRRAGFYPCNDGKSVIEANYLAVNPQHAGYVVVGLQDNGIIERASGSVWRHTRGGDGDGGGVVFDPLRPDRYLRQFHNGTWTSGPLDRTGTPWSSVKPEREESSFYSTPAGIQHTRSGVAVGQILVGTTRVWMSEDFGARWRTLPRGRDAVFPTYKPNQDKLRAPVLVCRWQNPDEAWILTSREIVHLGRAPGSDTATSLGTWTKTEHLLKAAIFPAPPPPPPAEEGLCRATVWTDLAVNLEGAGVRRGTLGAIYVGTTGHPTQASRDTLYWFDGTSRWHATNLRNQSPGGVPAPVTAIVADPARPEMVYVGTTVGVWQGTRTIAGAAVEWDWEPLLIGLPEACVEDLSLFDDGTVRLLRAAIMSRGVWELRLGSDVTDLTYVRVHDDDIRYRLPSLTIARDLVRSRSWHGSPDIRPRVATLAPPAPANLPWRFNKRPGVEVLRRFQASLRSRFGDPRFRGNGIWDRYFDECLRDNGAPVVSGRVTVNKAFYDNVMAAPHSTAEAWGAGPPSEADLFELTPELTEGDVAEASARLAALRAKVDVVVHHRGLDSIRGTDVRVALLRWLDPAARPNATGTWFSDDIGWAGAVNEVLNSAGGTTSRPLGPGWSFLETSTGDRRTSPAAAVLDNLHTGVATFDLDLTGLPVDSLVLLVAVIRAGDPSNVTARKLMDLALNDAHVAVRSLRIDA